MEAVIEHWQSLTNEQVLVYATIGAVLLSRSHAFRYLRVLAVPAGITFVAVRAIESRTPNVLEVIVSFIKSCGCTTTAHVILDILGLLVVASFVSCVVQLVSLDFTLAKKDFLAWGFNQVRGLSFVKAALAKEQEKLEEEFDKDLKVKSRSLGTTNSALPKKGLSKETILKLMHDATQTENVKWENGLVSGAVYNGQHKHIELLNEAFSLYSIANPLHPDIWPSVMKFDSEVIAMTANLVNGGDTNVCGSSSSGGTESIIMAIKSHRDFFREFHGITAPEMVVGNSAHAAVDKACDLMGIKLIKVPLDPDTFKIDLRALEAAIGPNTIMMYASAPSYPHGAIDPVREMGALAVRYSIGLHVDCCLGGFVLPFAKKMGYSVPDFDFSVPGVSSMSLDTHKYGYALKGTSVVLYRNRQLRQSQYFCYADWTGGMYTTPTIAGSRSGGLIAQCWASLMALGEEGYHQHTRDILAVTQEIAAGVREIQGLRLLGGTPEAMIVCFAGAEGVNIYSVSDKMAHRGWSLNALQNPPCVHICCTVTHVKRGEQFLKDLREAVQEVLDHPEAKGGNAAIYGLTSALPPGPVNELLKVYNDVVLKV